jgi:hypothetical protein
MAAKINKDVLIKNRFWILLSVTVVLAIVGLVFLQTASADALLVEFKTEYDKTKGVKPGTPGPDSINAIGKKAEEAKDSEAKVWQDAYRDQAKIFHWSDEIEAKFKFSSGMFANEIAVSKIAERESWPDDPPGGVLGTLQFIDGDVLKLKDRNKKEVTIYRTKNVKITSAEDKPLEWPSLYASRNKLLEVKYQVGKIFNDPLRGEELDEFKDSYLEQIDQILKTVEPLDEKGNGTVQLKNWLYNPEWVERYRKGTDRKPDDSMKFIRFVTVPWDNTGKNFSDEAWIAQENIWIQREIYRIIRSANDEIKVYKGKGGAKKAETYTFTNSNFQVELSLAADDALTFTIRNLQPRRQKLDLSFRVTMNDGAGAKAEVVNISGPPLLPKGLKAGAEKDWDTFTIPFPMDGKESPRRGIYRVEQVLTWETAAVKRIDHITIGSVDGTEIAHSHRTYPDGLRPLVEPKDKGAADEKRPGDGKMPAGPGIIPPGGPGLPGVGGLGAGGNTGALLHGLWKDRYTTDLSEQSRRIPVAVALIADQDHVDRVLTAFNNSKLRFLETQVLVNHYAMSLQPPLPDDRDGGVPGVPPVFPGGRPEGGSRPMVPFGPMAGGGIPGGAGMGQQPGASSDLETNMEVVIYGFMTLYQRYPPPAAAKKE